MVYLFSSGKSRLQAVKWGSVTIRIFVSTLEVTAKESLDQPQGPVA